MDADLSLGTSTGYSGEDTPLQLEEPEQRQDVFTKCIAPHNHDPSAHGTEPPGEPFLLESQHPHLWNLFPCAQRCLTHGRDCPHLSVFPLQPPTLGHKEGVSTLIIRVVSVYQLVVRLRPLLHLPSCHLQSLCCPFPPPFRRPLHLPSYHPPIALWSALIAQLNCPTLRSKHLKPTHFSPKRFA